jgi:hypothetical protein
MEEATTGIIFALALISPVETFIAGFSWIPFGHVYGISHGVKILAVFAKPTLVRIGVPKHSTHLFFTRISHVALQP